MPPLAPPQDDPTTSTAPTAAHARRIAMPTGALCALGAVATAASLVAAAPVAGASTLVIPKTKHPAVVVTMHGEGHGHGMSQYGAQGAALAGLSYRKIIAFYYPHTTLMSAAGTAIRVRLGSTGRTVTVAPATQLALSNVSGTLPVTGIARYRLAAGSGHTEILQQLASTPGATWTTVRTKLPNDTEIFRRNRRSVRLFDTDGTSTAYLGRLRAVRRPGSGASAGVLTVNRVNLDAYTAGVVPREMPASWAVQALAAQAVAARTYGLYAVRHPRSSQYDICASEMCQVYGGHVHYGRSGNVLWRDDRPATDTSAGRVLTYHGHVAFTQFSASNGGWTVGGGEPYLVSRRGPYDSAKSGDPYLSYDRTVPVSSIAAYYGLTKVTKIVVTKRDGHGTGGGRVLAGYVYGLRGKKSTRVFTTGDDLNWALDAGTTWFTLRNK